MDNFKRSRRAAPKRPSGVDGFMPSAAKSRSSQSGGSINNEFRRNAAYQPQRQQGQSIGGFRQADGFQRSSQPRMAAASTSSQGTLSVEQPWARRPQAPAAGIPKGKAKKKHWWSRKKNVDKSKHKWRRRILRVVIVLVIIAVLIGAFLAVKAYMKSKNILKGGGNAAALDAKVDPAKLKGEGDGRINVLLLGKGGDGHEAPDLTDTILLASIDPIHKDAALVSIPRDTWVKPKDTGSYTKINAVYANAKYKAQGQKKSAKDAEIAGLAAVQDTVSQVLGTPVHYHVMVDFKAFQDAVNAVGGVTLNVQTPLYERMALDGGKPYILDVKKGQQNFDGLKALMYSRSRHTSPRGDFDRAERQRAIMVALKEKILSLGTFGNPLKISQLLDAFGNHVQTDFDRNEILRMYEIGKDIPGNKVASIGLADPPNEFLTTSMISGQSVVIPKAGVGNYSEIQSFIRNTLKDSFIRDENANIMVLNGTSVSGLATKRGNELKSYGYNVGKVADSPVKGVQKTILVDLRGGQKKYTMHYLENRLNVTATNSLPTGIVPETADFVIILGQDQAGN